MSKTARIKVRDPGKEQDEVWAPCAQCDRETSHRALTGVHYEDADDMDGMWVEADYLVIQCQGCRELSFCEETTFSEDLDFDPDTGEPRTPTTRQYYPGRVPGRARLKQTHWLPAAVRRVYEETHTAFCNQLHILSGVGIRSVVEAVCEDKGIKGGLERKIGGLAEAHHITKEGATILHSLRFMGNAAAHEMRAHPMADIETAFDVIENLLTSVYILPREAQRLQRKREGEGKHPLEE